jgi:hypothetical protein
MKVRQFNNTTYGGQNMAYFDFEPLTLKQADTTRLVEVTLHLVNQSLAPDQGNITIGGLELNVHMPISTIVKVGPFITNGAITLAASGGDGAYYMYHEAVYIEG